MKIGIPGRLTTKNDPSPSQQFAGSSDNGEFAWLAAADQTLIKDMQRIATVDSTERAHIKQTPYFGITHLGDSGMAKDRTATDMGLWVKTDHGCQSFGRAFAIGERLPTIKQ